MVPRSACPPKTYRLSQLVSLLRTRRFLSTLLYAGVVLALLASFPGIAAAQRDPSTELGPGVRLGIRFGVGVVINLLLGGVLLGVAPRYVGDRVQDIRKQTGSVFLWGLLAGIGLPLVLALLAITIIGLVIAIPGLLVLAVAGLIGGGLIVLAIGSVFTGGDVDATALLAGALVLAVVFAIPVLGDLVNTLLGFLGIGAVCRSAWEGYR